MIVAQNQTITYTPQSRKAVINTTLFMPDNLSLPQEDTFFAFQGGSLVISPASWNGTVSSSLMAAPHSLTIDPGTGGQLALDYGGLSGASLQTNLSLDLHLVSPPPSGFTFQFTFSGQTTSRTTTRQRYDASANQTIIQMNEDYSFYSTVHANIFIPGNPYGLPQDGRWSPFTPPAPPQTSADVVCYLAGTLIDTPQGPRPIEELRAGDAIHVFRNGHKHIEHLRWSGWKSVTPTSSDDWPIRIRRHTFGENCPFRDLYITEEHCLLLKGSFIPARMLVNGRTILREERDSYDIYHIETYEHRIISANGVLSETYLDTGNRHSFTTPEAALSISSPASFHSRPKDWQQDAAAPLNVDRAFVEPLHAALAERATRLGFPPETARPATTDDPALTLLDPQGTELALYQRNGGHYLFWLKNSPSFLTIRSRTSRPDRQIGPFVDDRRTLGVLVGEITLVQPDGTDIPLTSHLTAAPNTGWDVTEPVPCRWTTGAAHLPLPDMKQQNGCLLKLEILSAGPYALA
ncbi:Hint domain-containing protein [Parasaccharibacter sp. TMW2.1890]|uniref:Hint domain-containing protein n=1 Tax=Parasaccharibacter sp. TMW2.1890 TaxID=2039289 RepID=UPI002011B8AA|nr:Hint domain-containing protein [Parasaccharibacter sp. TMW2.1890]MCL1515876.1 hypothetical protein [Parasaccharibacter sp. TMW2.1890]